MAPVLAFAAAGAVTILAVVLIVARPRLLPRLGDRAAAQDHRRPGRDDRRRRARSCEKSAPVNDVVTTINEQLDAGVDLLEGLLVKKAGMTRRRRPRRRPVPGAAAAGFRNFPESTDDQGAAHRRGLHERHAHARTARPGGADRRREPGGSRAAGRRARKPRGAAAVPGDPPDEAGVPAEVSGHRHRRARAVRAAGRHRGTAQAAPRPTAMRTAGSRRTMSAVPDTKGALCRPLRHSSTSARPASRARSHRFRGSARRRAIIAGGHSLLPMMKLRLANPEHLIDINDLDGALLHPRAGRRDRDRGADPPRAIC